MTIDRGTGVFNSNSLRNTAICSGVLLAALLWFADSLMEFLWYDSAGIGFLAHLLPLQDTRELIDRLFYSGSLIIGGVAVGYTLQLLGAQAKTTAGVAENLRITLDSIGDAVIATDLDGCIVRMNPVAMLMTGWNLADAQGKRLNEVFQIINAQTREVALNPVGTVLQTGEVVGLANHTLLIARDGTERQIADSAAPIRDVDGKTAGVVLVFRDVTREYAMQAALLNSEAQLRMLVENIPGVSYRCANDVCWTVDYISSGIETLSGYPVADFTENAVRCFDSLIYPDDRQMVREVVDEGLAQKRSFEIDYRIVRADGEIRWVFERGQGVYDEEGKVRYLAGVIIDTTDRKLAEQALQSQHERLSRIVEGAGVGTWEWNVQTGEVRFNEKWAEIIGYTLEELSPVSIETWTHFVHPEDIVISNQALERHFRGEADYHIECRMKHKQGYWVWIMDQGKVVSRTADGKPLWMFGTHIDISGRKRVEEALQKRLVALSRPLSDSSDVSFENLFNMNEIQRLQDEFANAAGVASIITHSDGTPITRPSNFCRLCKDIIRKSPKGCANCYASDAAIGKLRFDGPTIKPCLSSGLWDAGASITVGGKHVANWLIGQVRDQTQNEERMREYARKIEVDEEEVVRAFREVPAMSSDQFQKVAQALFTMANMLSVTAYQNVQQARFITERQRVEEELKRSANFTLALLEAIPTPVFYKDKNGAYQGCNRAFTEITGKTPEQIKGKTVFELWPDEFAQVYHQKDQEIFQNPSHQVYEYQIVDKNGAIRNVIFARDLYRDERGHVAGVVGAFLDISELKRAERDLRSNEENLRVTLNSIGDAVIATDTDGCVTRMNPIAEKLTGWTVTEATGRRLDEVFCIVNAATRQVAENPVGRVFATGEIVGLANHTVLISRSGKEYQIADSGAPIRSDAGQIIGVVLVFRDVTEEYALQMQLLQSQKLDALGQLAGGVAHDFNNMLCGIIGAADILKTATAGNEECAKFIGLILDSAERAADLARKLLSFARRQAPGSSPIDVHRSIQDAVAILRNTIDKRIVIETVCDARASMVIGDGGQLQGVFLNLGINAWHAMPEGGSLFLRTKNVEITPAYCQASTFALTPGNYIEVEVRDTGCGITQDDLPRIFDPFFTTKEQGKGTGLGLAAAYGTVQQHKGAISVYSEVGVGTCFRILLPLTDEAARTLPAPEAPVCGNGRILVIDDEAVMRATAQELLGEYGYEVTVAENGPMALQLFRENPSAFDLVILDMVMPQMNGRDCFYELRKIRGDISVILSSGFSSEEDLHELKTAGLSAFISKPYHCAELSRLVASVLNKP